MPVRWRGKREERRRDSRQRAPGSFEDSSVPNPVCLQQHGRLGSLPMRAGGTESEST